MSSNSDFIPAKDGEFDVWFKHLTQYVSDKTGGTSPVWTHIPAEEVSALNHAYTAWYTAYEPSLIPHTPGITEAKNEARKTAEGVIRPFKRRYLEDPRLRTSSVLIWACIFPTTAPRSPRLTPCLSLSPIPEPGAASRSTTGTRAPPTGASPTM